MAIIDRVLRIGEDRVLRNATKLTKKVNDWADRSASLTDLELKAKTEEFRKRILDGESTLKVLPEAFAVAREAADRVLGLRPYDVQIMGAVTLFTGSIAEMKTGEGKTLVAVLPAYLNAIAGKKVHVVTANDYLVKVGVQTVGAVYEFLGLTVDYVVDISTQEERKIAYLADITYGTSNQFGFDYLKDNIAISLEERVQRGHDYAIVDEVDSILIDEARTPLIISKSSEEALGVYPKFAEIMAQMKRARDYVVDEKDRTVSLTEGGIRFLEDSLEIKNLYTDENSYNVLFAVNALKAKTLFLRDRDYVVRDGKLIIVDTNTGRLLPESRYNNGLHQALEAKEGLEVFSETNTHASITVQNYFRLYKTLSGMTGTAITESAEFWNTYKLAVVAIPTNKPVIRIDETDLVYRNARGKFNAIVEDIIRRNQKGQPVLIGTTSVEKSEYLSSVLTRAGISHDVLNAKNNEREAEIIADAGRLGRVTIATNMAGRGTDIMLGGDVTHQQNAILALSGVNEVEEPEKYAKAKEQARLEAKATVAAEREKVLAAGGLYVLGTERNDSRRVDNQLRGRSGRQGDPGESRFYLAVDDDMMRVFSGDVLERIMNALDMSEDTPIEAKNVAKTIANAQSQVEGQNADTRKEILKYDDVINKQRIVIYQDRLELLGADLTQLDTLWKKFARQAIQNRVEAFSPNSTGLDWDLTGLIQSLTNLYPVTLTPEELKEEANNVNQNMDKFLLEEIFSDLTLAAESRISEFDEERRCALIRGAILSQMDYRWREHLFETDYLREGISLRSYGSKNPIIEYEKEAYLYFEKMIELISEDSVHALFQVDLERFRASVTKLEDEKEETISKEVPTVQENFVEVTEEAEKTSTK